MSPQSEGDRETIAAQAAEWFVANREPLDPAQKAQFGEWLRRSPRHEQEYLVLLRLAGRLQRASLQPPSVEALIREVRSGEAASVTPISAARRRTPFTLSLRRPWLYAAAAAGLACVAVLLLRGQVGRQPSQMAQIPSQHYRTGHGQQLTQSLADGSQLRLDTDSAVTVRYGRGLRQLEVTRGRAAFTVAHDPTHPFRVIAGSAQVVALGTLFDVYLQGEGTLVTVVEGRVAVGSSRGVGTDAGGDELGTPAGRGPPPAGGSVTVAVSAGQQVRVLRGLVQEPPSPVDARRATAWLNRQLVFEHETLSVVAAEFSRYSPTPVVVESPQLGALPVSGVFNVDDTESFVAFLRSLQGAGVEVTPTRVRVFKL